MRRSWPRRVLSRASAGDHGDADARPRRLGQRQWDIASHRVLEPQQALEAIDYLVGGQEGIRRENGRRDREDPKAARSQVQRRTARRGDHGIGRVTQGEHRLGRPLPREDSAPAAQTCTKRGTGDGAEGRSGPLSGALPAAAWTALSMGSSVAPPTQVGIATAHVAGSVPATSRHGPAQTLAGKCGSVSASGLSRKATSPHQGSIRPMKRERSAASRSATPQKMVSTRELFGNERDSRVRPLSAPPNSHRGSSLATRRGSRIERKMRDADQRRMCV